MIELPFSDENAAALGIRVAHHFAGNCYAKEARMAAGTSLESHEHPFPHLSVLAGGAVVVEAGGVETRYTGYACIEIKAGVKHKITAISEAIWLCLWDVPPGLSSGDVDAEILGRSTMPMSDAS